MKRAKAEATVSLSLIVTKQLAAKNRKLTTFAKEIMLSFCTFPWSILLRVCAGESTINMTSISVNQGSCGPAWRSLDSTTVIWK